MTRPGYEKSKLLGSLDNWEPGQLSRILTGPYFTFSEHMAWHGLVTFHFQSKLRCIRQPGLMILSVSSPTLPNLLDWVPGGGEQLSGN